MGRRWIRILAGIAGLVLVGSVGAQLAFARPRPSGVSGPAAEAAAHRIESAIQAEAWERTGAVTFALGGRHYLWDRERSLVRYTDRRGVVLTEAHRPMGRAFHDGVEFSGPAKDRRVRHAYRLFVNDAFWAFAPFKIRDTGAVLELVLDEGREGLLVRYPTGGVTPGDAFLWEWDGDGTPSSLSIWARIIPIFKGLEAEWSDWVTLDTGARVARTRRLGPFTLRVTELRGAARLSDIEVGDPFAPMFAPADGG